ncbi:capsular biosynthesis protein [Asaia sp. VD9]|uniref:capsular biosynthesis protein n=1 Tax=Asaia sp. VD9 TaxID=3081235 RepID=UPI003017DD26
MIREDRVLVVDVDGTLCDIKESGESYLSVAPEATIVEKLRELHQQGWHIILNSSRGMRSSRGNLGVINKEVSSVMLQWLSKHEIPFDELHLGKPWAGHNGFYIDDRAVRPREFVDNDLDAIEELIKRDRIAKG